MSSARALELGLRAVSDYALAICLCSPTLACGPSPGDATDGTDTAAASSSPTMPTSGASVTDTGAKGSGSAADAGTATSGTSAASEGTGTESSSSAGPATVTAEECFAITTEAECAASACSGWFRGARVVIDEFGDCACEGAPWSGPPVGYCLLFEGDISGGTFAVPLVTQFEPALVVDFNGDFINNPLGWESCSDVVDPPPACACLDGIDTCSIFDPPR